MVPKKKYEMKTYITTQYIEPLWNIWIRNFFQRGLIEILKVDLFFWPLSHFYCIFPKFYGGDNQRALLNYPTNWFPNYQTFSSLELLWFLTTKPSVVSILSVSIEYLKKKHHFDYKWLISISFCHKLYFFFQERRHLHKIGSENHKKISTTKMFFKNNS